MILLHRRSTICGIGINDSDYVTKKCKIYKKWRAMFQRCYSDKYQERFPWYKGCSVAKEWHLFSNFKKWMESQDWEGKALDKDLIKYGNKIYSPETCLLVTRDVNNFFNSRGAVKGKYPIGVHFLNVNGSSYIQASCSNPDKTRKRYKKLFKTHQIKQATDQYWEFKRQALNNLIKNHRDIECILRLHFVCFKRDHSL